MTTTIEANTTDPTRKTGLLARFWRALIEIDGAIHFDPLENLEKRLRLAEIQLAAQSQRQMDLTIDSNRTHGK